jgi:uncharacterized protein (DUF2141 family)
MRQIFFKTFVFVLVFISIISCANRGTPSGGEKDILPPKITRSSPENFSTNFKGKEIRIYFDEYIKIKDVQKQLIISPPMDPEPIVTPMGTANKYIKIVINDTLDDNTTYAFNFGQSVVDNNEENPYPYYRFVFSTGDYIDSLSVKGTIMDAEKRAADKFVSVMLYDMDSTFTDSIVYKKKPKYITNTLDSVTTFSIDNIKAGNYMLVALKDENRNFTFQQKSDKIGFYEQPITVPSDSTYNIKLFKEELDFRAERPKQIAGQKIAFGYEGDAKQMKIEMLDDRPDDLEVRLTKDPKTDTLYYWYKPKLELDSTLFVVRNKTFIDTLKHRFRDLPIDTLVISAVNVASLGFDDEFMLQANIPFSKFDESKIKILDKDSVNVTFKARLDSLKNTFAFQFERKESNAYAIQILPETFTDFFGNVNDTLSYSIRTKAYDQFGNVRVKLVNAEYPLIIQLTDDKGVVKYEKFATEPRLFDFRYLNPGNYYLRVIFDVNENQKWDSGSYLQKRQPERISYYPELLEARSGWDLLYDFILEKTNPDPLKN